MKGSLNHRKANRTKGVWAPLALCSLVLLFCGGFYLREAGLIEKNVAELEKSRVDMFAQLFRKELKSVSQDLRGLATVESLRTYLTTGNHLELDRAMRRAVLLSRLHPEFDQIRFLNEQGREEMRVNRGGVIVPAAKLQDKSDALYFKRAFALKPGQIYVSAIDLNTENDRMEEPLKPTLRFAVPIFDATGKRRGVYVLNYLFGNFLMHLQELRPDISQRLRVLNERGYWLKAAQPTQEWGFAFPERQEETLARGAPEIWRRMTEEPGGQHPHLGGMMTWRQLDLKQNLAADPNNVVTEEDRLLMASEIVRDEFGSLFTNLRWVFGILSALLLLATISAERFLHSRERAIEALRSNEEDLKVTLHSIGDAVLATDAQRRIVRLNPIAEKLTGWTQAEAVGRLVEEVFRIINEDTRQPVAIPVDAVLTTGEIQGLANHTILIAKDGAEHPIADSAAPIRDRHGNILGVVLVFREVAEERRVRKEIEQLNESLERRVQERTAELAQANESLSGSERRFRALIEQSADSISVIDANNNIHYLSPSVTAVEGYTAEELIGRNGMENTHPDDLPLIQEIVGQLLAHPGKPIPVLWRRRHKDGHWLWLEGVATNLLNDPAIGGIVTNYRDVTERKLAQKHEATFSRLAQSLSEVASAPAAARIIAEAANELLGWDACSLDAYVAAEGLIYPIINIDTINGQRVDVQSAYVGQPPSPLAKTVLEKGAQLILREGTFGLSAETVPFGDKGRPSASLMYVPMRRGQQPIGILSIQSYTLRAYDQKALNILQALADQCGGALERIRAEEELRLLNDQLEQRVQKRTEQLAAANKELEAFSYSVSHDLRAPLRHIDGFVTLVQKEAVEKLSPTGKRFLGIVSESAKRMGILIDDLLVFSRFGRTQIREDRVAMSSLLEQAKQEMVADLQGRNIQWEIGTLPEVMGDRAMLKQVWVNLLGNAVKYTRQRDPAHITVAASKNDRDEWEFSVRDNGAGFEMEYVGKLFGVFQRLHRAEEFEGTGIGLANVQRIVLRHGGRVWAVGKVNEGATFYFALPVGNVTRET